MRGGFGTNSDNLVPGLVFLLLALPMVLGAGYMIARSLYFAGFAEETTGTIVEITGGTPALSVEFTTTSGQTRVMRTHGSDLYENFMVGDTVTVNYDPKQPSDARADLFVEMWLMPMFLGVLGAFFTVPAIFMLRGWVGEKLALRSNLDRNGQRIQADYAGVRITLDPNILRQRRNLGSVELISGEGSQTILIHNGRTRDPTDPEVQHELGLRFVLQARWTSPDGRDYRFESPPQIESPERWARGRKITVLIDPRKPQRYRMEVPGSKVTMPRTSAIE